MAFATVDDIAARLGRDLTTAEQAMATALIKGATSVVAGAAGQDSTWAEALDPVPDALETITIEMVVRVMVNPTGAETISQQLGSSQFTTTWAAESAGLTLTRAERRTIRRALGLSTAAAVTFESPYSGETSVIEETLP